MIPQLYTLITGKPWTTTTRHCTAEFGPNLAAQYATEWAGLSTAEAILYDREDLITYAKAQRAAQSEELVSQHR